jgi:hypothetical protein
MATVFVFVSYCLIKINTATARQLPYKAQEKISCCIRKSVKSSYEHNAVVSLSVTNVDAADGKEKNYCCLKLLTRNFVLQSQKEKSATSEHDV